MDTVGSGVYGWTTMMVSTVFEIGLVVDLGSYKRK